MAINYKVGEAIEALKKGDTQTKIDIGRRFPLFTILAVQLNDAAIEMANAIPSHITARQIESRLKGDTAEVDTEDDTDEEEEAPTPAQKPKAKVKAKVKPEPEPEEDDEDEDESTYAGKSAKELYDMAKGRGLTVKTKQKAAVYQAILEADDEEEEEEEAPAPAPKPKTKPKTKAKAKATVVDDDDEWEV